MTPVRRKQDCFRYTSRKIQTVFNNNFGKYPKEEREKVKYFVLDMWQTYYDTACIWFKNAIRIVDKYHWIRQVIWAFENVRKEEQKKFSKTHRRYFKNSKKLLLKRFNKSEYVRNFCEP